MTAKTPIVDSSFSNPFLGGIVSDAWRSAEADVPDIHGTVFAKCLEAVEVVRHSEQSSAVVVFGEQGSGKTHLLSRLQRRLTDASHNELTFEAPWQIFVYIRMRTSSGRIWRKIRAEFVSDLMRPMPDGLTQLEHVLARQLSAHLNEESGNLVGWWSRFRDQRVEQLIDAWYQFAEVLRLDVDLIDVIALFIRGKHRKYVRAYLSGSLLTEHGFRQLFGNVDPSLYNPDNEDDACKMVVALCRIAGPKVPVVFCFDQIEAIEVEGSERGPVWYLAKAVGDLVSEACVAVISCVLAHLDTPKIRKQDLARFTSGGKFTLNRLTSEQMRQLIRSRVMANTATAKVAGTDTDWPFDRDDPLFSSRLTPRELLAAAASRFDAMRDKTLTLEHMPTTRNAAPTPTVSLADEFEKRVEEAKCSQSPEGTDDLIAATLPSLLPIVENGWTIEYPVSPANAQRDLEMVLVGRDGEARVGVALCNQKNMTSLAGRLNRLKANRNSFNLHKLVMVRDNRLPISPGARATRERLDELTKEDGLFVRPTIEVLAVLDAVRSLLADATSGDLALDGRSLGVSSVREWLAMNLDATAKEWIDLFRLPPRPGWVEDEQPSNTAVDGVLDFLEQEPVASVDQVARALQLDASQLVEVAELATDRIGVIHGTPTVLFRVLNRLGMRTAPDGRMSR